MNHASFALLTSVLLSAGLAAVDDRTARERAAVAVRVFLCCAVCVVGGGWLMRLIHG
jgi:alkylhydroperoxidase family enzyme